MMNEDEPPVDETTTPVKKTRPQSTRRLNMQRMATRQQKQKQKRQQQQQQPAHQQKQQAFVHSHSHLRHRRELVETDKKDDGSSNTEDTADDNETTTYVISTPEVGQDIRTIRGMEFPYCRYGQLWHQLTGEQQQVLEDDPFNYDQLNFNFPHSNSIEEVKWSKLDWTDDAEREAFQAQFPCLTPDTWDLFINHYYDNWWMDLEVLGVDKFYTTLGWNQELWDFGEYTDSDTGETITDPWSDDVFWQELTPFQQAAARQVGWFPEIWNGQDPMQLWNALPQPQIVTSPNEQPPSSGGTGNPNPSAANNKNNNDDSKNLLWAIILVVVGVMMLACFGLYFLAKRVFGKKSDVDDGTDPDRDMDNNDNDNNDNDEESTSNNEADAVVEVDSNDMEKALPPNETNHDTIKNDSEPVPMVMAAQATTPTDGPKDKNHPLTDVSLEDPTASNEPARTLSTADETPPRKSAAKLFAVGPIAAARKFWSSKRNADDKSEEPTDNNKDNETNSPKQSFASQEDEHTDQARNDEAVDVMQDTSTDFSNGAVESTPPLLASSLSKDESVVSRDPPGESQPVPEPQVVESNPTPPVAEEKPKVEPLVEEKPAESRQIIAQSVKPISSFPIAKQTSDGKISFKHKKEIEDYQNEHETLQIGSLVWIKRRGQPLAQGEVEYLGAVSFEPGDNWVGIRLTGNSAGRGKNNGTVQGRSYFTCPPYCGLFVRSNFVTLRTTAPTKLTTALSNTAKSAPVATNVPSEAAESSPPLSLDVIKDEKPENDPILVDATQHVAANKLDVQIGDEASDVIEETQESKELEGTMESGTPSEEAPATKVQTSEEQQALEAVDAANTIITEMSTVNEKKTTVPLSDVKVMESSPEGNQLPITLAPKTESSSTDSLLKQPNADESAQNENIVNGAAVPTASESTSTKSAASETAPKAPLGEVPNIVEKFSNQHGEESIVGVNAPAVNESEAVTTETQ